MQGIFVVRSDFVLMTVWQDNLGPVYYSFVDTKHRFSATKFKNIDEANKAILDYCVVHGDLPERLTVIEFK